MNTNITFIIEPTQSIIELVTGLITRAYDMSASDIHIDPQEQHTIVRFRIDGLLQVACTIPYELHGEVIARLKVMAGLRTDERLLPQDGRYSFNDSLDIRLTTVASYYGESAVLRLLSRTATHHSLTVLGFSEHNQKQIANIVTYPHGLVLITGPTGSGKTTTLYTLLNMLNRSTHSVVTIEDPIEYSIEGVRQLQVHNKRGIHFSTGLRSILRQDPDIIMVGEIRDTETALLAIQAALTGHLVISTLHTNSAVSTIARLVDMGIEPYLLVATLRLVVNQRLIRTVCKKCVQKKLITDKELQFAFNCGEYIEATDMVVAQGCDQCCGTGYKGRSVIAEVLGCTEVLQQAIMKKFSSTELEKIARAEGMKPIISAGITKCINHATTFEELARVSYQ